MSNNEIIPTTKGEFVENIKQWVLLDNQLKIVNEKTKQMRERKAQLNSDICNYVNEKNMNNVNVEISDGILKFYKRKEYRPITYKFLEESLNEIMPHNSAAIVMKHIKDKREIIMHDDIRRNYKK